MLPSSGQQFYCLYSTGTESSPCKGPADSKSIIFQNSFIFIMRDASIVKVPPAIAICENIIIFYFKVSWVNPRTGHESSLQPDFGSGRQSRTFLPICQFSSRILTEAFINKIKIRLTNQLQHKFLICGVSDLFCFTTPLCPTPHCSIVLHTALLFSPLLYSLLLNSAPSYSTLLKAALLLPALLCSLLLYSLLLYYTPCCSTLLLATLLLGTLIQWFSILVLGTPCPARFRCFPPQTHLIQINGSLSGPFIWPPFSSLKWLSVHLCKPGWSDEND